MPRTMPKQKPHRSVQSVQTPPDFIAAVLSLLGIKAFVHDFAADRKNTQARTYWDKQIDSLSRPPAQWARLTAKGWGWLNPEYTKIGPWAKRCQETREAGGHITLLVPASVGSRWFIDYVEPSAFVLALCPRLRFVGHRTAYPKDLILAVYAPDWEPGFHSWEWK